jgi:hypothetical protein
LVAAEAGSIRTHQRPGQFVCALHVFGKRLVIQLEGDHFGATLSDVPRRAKRGEPCLHRFQLVEVRPAVGFQVLLPLR